MNLRRNRVRRAHAPRAKLAARHVAIIRPDNANTVINQLRKIALGCGMRPHAHIHGRRDHHRLIGCE